MWKQSPDYRHLASDTKEFLAACMPDGFDDLMADILRRIEQGNNFKPRLFYSTLDTVGTSCPPSTLLRISAVALEIFHQLTSILDDITDGDYEKSELVLPRAFQDEGMTAVVLCHLLACSDHEILSNDDIDASKKIEIARQFTNVKKQTCQGQFVDVFLAQKSPKDAWLNWYLNQCSLKVNAFMMLPVSLATIINDTDAEVRALLEMYAWNAGTAHQIGDDFKDGIEGGRSVLTYPFAYALDHGSDKEFSIATQGGIVEKNTTIAIQQACDRHVSEMKAAAIEKIWELRSVTTPPFILPDIEFIFDNAIARVNNRTHFQID